jgi:hypothetical protein
MQQSVGRYRVLMGSSHRDPELDPGSEILPRCEHVVDIMGPGQPAKGMGERLDPVGSTCIPGTRAVPVWWIVVIGYQNTGG